MIKKDIHISRIREIKNDTQSFFHSLTRQLYVICILCTLCVSCEVETHSNGKIDGYWHLVKIDTMATGGITDLSEQRIFWAMQANLAKLRDYDQPDSVFIMRFVQDDNTLVLGDIHIYDREQGDPIAELSPALTHLGINKTEEHFTIEQLKSTRMTISSDLLRLSFKKH
jgi:hypothetical protein